MVTNTGELQPKILESRSRKKSSNYFVREVDVFSASWYHGVSFWIRIDSQRCLREASQFWHLLDQRRQSEGVGLKDLPAFLSIGEVIRYSRS